ncbi:HAMP domain-containing sensor histidine kinase [Paenibacillus cremeus]|uniref:histidine kinase n=1 Tax=Paenibacillus cremeus TaxID=2163881 RepID=A0A559K6B9_9BACL|nr:hypothetical protein FPZ49_22675 [Paenibacillus cremeus]
MARTYTEGEITNKGNWRAFVRLLMQANPPKLILTIALTLSIISTLVGLMIPLFTKNAVDSFSVSSISWTQIGGMGVAFILMAIGSGISIYLLNYAGQCVVAGIRDRLWKKLLVLPVRYYDNNQTGETISRMTNDTAVIKELTSISGFSRALKSDTISDAERTHYLDIIEAESKRLSKLSDNLLKLSSLESQQHPFEPRSFRLDKQLRNLVLACEPQWVDKQMVMDIELAEVTITADEDLLSQVWTNLIHNAIKFTPAGGAVGVSFNEQFRESGNPYRR